MDYYYEIFNGYLDYVGEVFFENSWSAFLIWFGLTLLAITLPIKLNRIRVRF